MATTSSILGLILLLPLLGFLVNGALILVQPKKQQAPVAGAIASTAIFGAFLVSLKCYFDLTHLDPENRVLEQVAFQWIQITGFDLPFVLRLDPLNSLMTLIVTGVGFLIHVYSIGYMGHDATPGKFFAYLNLFCFAMLALVLGGNLPILFLGWEGVGLCSYLLIGYWYEDPAKAAAGMKAFVVNRIGDLGFLAGIFFIFTQFGTLDFAALKSAVAAGAGNLDIHILTIATLCLFVGAMGKSAQIPLYVWLPDAMAGPTPVSALIHAATMVTAGVYMICRLNFMYSLCPTTLTVVSVVGAVTACFAATIALVQTDIKKVLAYSTVSQLGYMFMAVGVGFYTAGVFHLMTHAFFKALLFLGSGSVIHGMHEEQDILKMGGLQKHMPKTFATFAVGTIAIAGIPPLAGFWSKDEILLGAFTSHMGAAGPALWAMGAVTAFMTAYYMTRLTCLTFLGKERFVVGHAHGHGHGHSHDHNHDGHDTHHGHRHGSGGAVHVHESPMLMVAPLVVLAILSIFGGFLGVPGHSVLEHWLEPVVGAHSLSPEAHHWEWILMGVSTLIALSGMGLGYFVFVKNLNAAQKLKHSLSAVHEVLTQKYYVDELYDFLFVRRLKQFSVWLWKVIDALLIDGLVVGVGRVSQFSGEVVRLFQTGAVQTYAFYMVLGFGALLAYVLFR